MKHLFFTAALCGLTTALALAEPLEVGKEAPKITATGDDGKPVNLSKVYAKGLTLVYFYPKASSPGCTSQACSLRDGIADLKADGVTVIGVSHDSVESQKAFKDKQHLPFTLIADEDSKVREAFGVPTMIFGMAKRQSFLIKDGRVVWRSLSAQTKGHAEEVEKAVAALK